MTDIAQFRADFKAAFAHWRASGEISDVEHAEQYRAASRAVQQKMHDAEWMKCAADHFRSMAAQIEADAARTRRIAAEVRAEREQAKK